MHLRSEVVIRIYSGFKTDRHLDRHIASILINSIPIKKPGENLVDLTIKADKELTASAIYSQNRIDLPCRVITEDFIRAGMCVEGNPTALIFPDFKISKDLFTQLNFADL